MYITLFRTIYIVLYCIVLYCNVQLYETIHYRSCRGRCLFCAEIYGDAIRRTR